MQFNGVNNKERLYSQPSLDLRMYQDSMCSLATRHSFMSTSSWSAFSSSKCRDSVQRLLPLPCPWVPSPYCVEAHSWVARLRLDSHGSSLHLGELWLPIVKAPGCLTGTKPQLCEAFVNMYNYVNVKDTSHGCGLLFCPC